MMQFVVNAIKNSSYPLNQLKEDLFTVDPASNPREINVVAGVKPVFQIGLSSILFDRFEL